MYSQNHQAVKQPGSLLIININRLTVGWSKDDGPTSWYDGGTTSTTGDRYWCNIFVWLEIFNFSKFVADKIKRADLIWTHPMKHGDKTMVSRSRWHTSESDTMTPDAQKFPVGAPSCHYRIFVEVG